MKTTVNLIQQLMVMEGHSLEAYKDEAGVPTIGYGHTKGVRMGDRISEQWAVELLKMDIQVFKGAKLLIAADCTAYAYANFHQEFMRGKVTIVGCPKLDPVDYSEKLTEILRENDVKSVTIVRMEVPCCGGLEMAAKKALQESGKFIPWQVVTLSLDGKMIDS